MESMAASYTGISIHFSIVAPGPVASAVVANVAEPNEAAPEELRPAVEAFQLFMGDLVANVQSPDNCAEYFIKAATDERPQLRYDQQADPPKDPLQVCRLNGQGDARGAEVDGLPAGRDVNVTSRT